ncbi:coiled-coil domain-containing protein 25 [Cinnamomum micranthum f. kanehirae]|uniref:Coiled-coil domain-containing protein 25 n=1 Tax=Cinnamomum micranthum f. kanehirae TaxID=337451 RepID=A0A443N1V2_9MAGN|nr:coiled-coil domain-containing protein 25 [Cinnamomum micranthum f. kanehirae]
MKSKQNPLSLPKENRFFLPSLSPRSILFLVPLSLSLRPRRNPSFSSFYRFCKKKKNERRRAEKMVFYYKARPEAGDYTIFMGLDKHENEELIKYGFLEDIWFHVDKMSSAHVYVRLNKGQTMDDISEGLLEDCAQLVKANSIQGNAPFACLTCSMYLTGNKVNNIDVVYTPWYNLKKTPSMEVGQVGFHNPKIVRTVRVEKRIKEIVNRLNKTKVERQPDLRAELEAVNTAERSERKSQLRDKKRREEMERLEKERQAEMRSYKSLMVSDKMTSNKEIAATSKSLQELEEDFM